VNANAPSSVSINPVMTGIALAMAALLAVTVWHYDAGPVESHRAITVAVLLLGGALLVATMGLRFADGRRATLVRMTGTLALPVVAAVLAWLAVIDATAFAIVIISIGIVLVCALIGALLVGATAHTPKAPRGSQGASQS